MALYGSLLVDTLTIGPFVANCYLVADAQSGEALVVDPGDEPARILGRLGELGLKPAMIVATHGHVDHVAAAPAILLDHAIPFAMHAADADWTEHLRDQCLAFGLPPQDGPVLTRPLTHGEVLRVGSLEATVLHTPGHTSGGICLFFQKEGALFSGDTLFQGSIGRTDLPGGDMNTLMHSLLETLATIPDETVVFSGHGPSTTMGRERRYNPFLRGKAPQFQGARFI